MKFRVNYSIDVNYEIVVEAESEDEAVNLVYDGNFDDEESVICGEEFLNINDVRMEC
jgi:hypothetical protein